MWIPLILAATLLAPQDPKPPISVVIVNSTSGAPIPGAEVFAIEERLTPTWGDFWSTHSLVTDKAGSVTVPGRSEAAPYSWVIVRAEGFGAKSAMEELERYYRDGGEVRVELMPETPVTVDLRDFTGAPLSLAHLGVTMGCGHTPDMVSAVTGPDGRAEFHGLYDYDGGIKDLFIVHPAVSRMNYSHIPMEEAVDGVITFYADHGSVLRGVILNPDGSPAPDFAVGYNRNHRGPWALTDANGRFEFFGFDKSENYIEVRDRDNNIGASFHGSRDGMFRTLRLNGTTLPEEAPPGDPNGRVPEFQIRFEIDLEGDGAARLRQSQRAVHVEVWDPKTGMCFIDETNEEGVAEVWVPEGEYLMEMGATGTPFAPTGLGRVSVGPDPQRELGSPESPSHVVKMAMPAPRLVTLQVAGVEPGDHLTLMTEHGYTKFEAPDPSFVLADDGTLTVENYGVPYGRVGAFLWRDRGDSKDPRIQLRVDSTTKHLETWKLKIEE